MKIALIAFVLVAVLIAWLNWPKPDKRKTGEQIAFKLSAPLHLDRGDILKIVFQGIDPASEPITESVRHFVNPGMVQSIKITVSAKPKAYLVQLYVRKSGTENAELVQYWQEPAAGFQEFDARVYSTKDSVDSLPPNYLP